MFDFSWGEVLLIGAVALIVIGPKDLPAALRTVGRMIGRVKRMASEFQGQFNEALREADLDKVRKDVEGMNKTASSGFNPVKSIRDEMKGAIEKTGTAAGAATMAAPNASASNAAAFAGTKVGAPKVEAVAPASDKVEPDLPAVQAQAPEQPASKPQAKTAANTAAKPKAQPKAEPEAAPAKKPAAKAASKAPSKPRGKPAVQPAAEAPAKKSAAASRKKEEKQT